MFILKQTFIITIQLEKILKKLSEDSSRETRFLIEKEILHNAPVISKTYSVIPKSIQKIFVDNDISDILLNSIWKKVK